jgi:hypothetical protein
MGQRALWPRIRDRLADSKAAELVFVGTVTLVVLVALGAGLSLVRTHLGNEALYAAVALCFYLAYKAGNYLDRV